MREALDIITRILTVPVPFRVGDRLVYPREGYDPRFGTYLASGAPKIALDMPMEEARSTVRWVYREFCLSNSKDDQKACTRSRDCWRRSRGDPGLVRTPLWYYIANRPCAGKDYCAAIPLLIFEGVAFEDQPIGKNEEETRKRLIAAALAVR